MRSVHEALRIATLIAAFSAGPLFCQQTPTPTTGGPQSGTPGSETVNRTAPGNNAATNSSMQGDRDGNMGINLGWLGLLGLGGLFGLRRGNPSTNS